MTTALGQRLSTRDREGFSLVEVLTVVAILGILATVAIVAVGNIGERSREAKAISDAKTLNRAVSSYLYSNGNLDGLTTAEEVIAKLKTAADSDSRQRHLGLTGSFLDAAVVPVPLKESSANEDAWGIRWEAAHRKFVVVSDGSAEIRGVTMDRAAAESPPTTEERGVLMPLAQHDPWIWDYQDASAPPPPSSEVIPTSVIPTSAPAPTTVPSPPPPPSNRLDPPQFSIPGSTRPISDFDLSVLLINPNPAGSSQIVYSLDFGSWRNFTGAGLVIPPGSTIRAQSISSDPTTWRDSQVANQTYSATPVPLDPPVITASTNWVSSTSAGSEMTASISISHSNPIDVSDLRYRINGGSWTSYSGEFNIRQANYPNGALVESKVFSTTSYYLDSSAAGYEVQGEPEVLLPPVINFSSDRFTNSVKSIRVGLDNPNPADTSTIYFQIVPTPGGPGQITPLEPYTGTFTVSSAFYAKGFGVRTYASATKVGYLDSRMETRFATEEVGLFGGHLDLDTSTSLSKVFNGSTDAHTHDITTKYGINEIDFFRIPEGKQIEITEAITSPSQRFKVTAVNASLSPGLNMILEYELNGRIHSINTSVADYDNTPVSELPVFTLSGAGGTAKLTSLKIGMAQDLIYKAGVIPTNTGDVKDNILGRRNEWRNGSLTLQALAVSGSGADLFGTDNTLSAGDHGAATSGLLWEAALFWHWDGDSYHEKNNEFSPGDFLSILENIEDQKAAEVYLEALVESEQLTVDHLKKKADEAEAKAAKTAADAQAARQAADQLALDSVKEIEDFRKKEEQASEKADKEKEKLNKEKEKLAAEDAELQAAQLTGDPVAIQKAEENWQKAADKVSDQNAKVKEFEDEAKAFKKSADDLEKAVKKQEDLAKKLEKEAVKHQDDAVKKRAEAIAAEEKVTSFLEESKAYLGID